MRFGLMMAALTGCMAVDTWSGGPTFTMEYDSANDAIKIEATVPSGTYLGLAYGQNMVSTDLLFIGGSGSSGDVRDLWGTYNGYPMTDST